MQRTLRQLLRLVLITAGAPLPAQTFIVDRQNGPGTHYTSLAAAIAAVPDGAVLRVRAGYYLEEFAIVGKGLTILGEPGASVSVPMTSTARIAQTAPHQTVVVRNLSLFLNSHNAANLRLSVANCQGLVLIERTPTISNAYLSLDVRGCARVVARDCDLRNNLAFEDVHVENSHCVFERCVLGDSSTAGLFQSGGTVQLVDTTVTGGAVFGPAPHAVVTHQGDLRVLGQSTLVGGRSAFGGFGYAITGTSPTRLEPSVTLGGATPPLDPALPVVVRGMPRLLTSVAGAQVQADLYGPAQQLGLLLFGLPGTVLPVPGCEDPFWLDGTLLAVVAVGTFQPAVPVTHLLPLSGNPALVGVCLGWQGASYDSVAGFQLSNPSFHVLR